MNNLTWIVSLKVCSFQKSKKMQMTTIQEHKEIVTQYFDQKADIVTYWNYTSVY